MSGEIVPIDTFQRRQEPHAQEVAEAGGRSWLQKLFEELAGHRKAGSKVEEVSSIVKLDQDLVAADLAGYRIAGGPTVHRQRDHVDEPPLRKEESNGHQRPVSILRKMGRSPSDRKSATGLGRFAARRFDLFSLAR